MLPIFLVVANFNSFIQMAATVVVAMDRTTTKTSGINLEVVVAAAKVEDGVRTIIQAMAIATVVDQSEEVITITIAVAVHMEVRPPGL